MIADKQEIKIMSKEWQSGIGLSWFLKTKHRLDVRYMVAEEKKPNIGQNILDVAGKLTVQKLSQ